MSNFARMDDLDEDSRIAAQLQVEEMAIAQMGQPREMTEQEFRQYEQRMI